MEEDWTIREALLRDAWQRREDEVQQALSELQGRVHAAEARAETLEDRAKEASAIAAEASRKLAQARKDRAPDRQREKQRSPLSRREDLELRIRRSRRGSADSSAPGSPRGGFVSATRRTPPVSPQAAAASHAQRRSQSSRRSRPSHSSTEVQGQLSETHKRLSATCAELQRWKTNKAAADAALRELEDTVAQLTAKLKTVDAERFEATKELRKLRREQMLGVNTGLRQELGEARLGLVERDEQLASRRSQIQAGPPEQQALRDRVSVLDRELGRADAAVEQLRAQLEAERIRAEGADTAKPEDVVRLARAMTDLSEERDKVRRTEAQLAREQSRGHEMAAQLAVLSRRCDTFQERARRAEAQVDSAQRQAAEFQRKAVELVHRGAFAEASTAEFEAGEEEDDMLSQLSSESIADRPVSPGHATSSGTPEVSPTAVRRAQVRLTRTALTGLRTLLRGAWAPEQEPGAGQGEAPPSSIGASAPMVSSLSLTVNVSSQGADPKGVAFDVHSIAMGVARYLQVLGGKRSAVVTRFIASSVARAARQECVQDLVDSVRDSIAVVSGMADDDVRDEHGMEPPKLTIDDAISAMEHHLIDSRRRAAEARFREAHAADRVAWAEAQAPLEERMRTQIIVESEQKDAQLADARLEIDRLVQKVTEWQGNTMIAETRARSLQATLESHVAPLAARGMSGGMSSSPESGVASPPRPASVDPPESPTFPSFTVGRSFSGPAQPVELFGAADGEIHARAHVASPMRKAPTPHHT